VPAIKRTSSFLFRPFDWSTYLKLTAAACLTEAFLVSFRFTAASPIPSEMPNIDLSAFHPTPWFLFFAVLAAAAALLIALLCFALVIQLRFAFFHCLAHQTRAIRPAWPLYRAQAGRFFRANLLVWLGFLVLIALVIAAFVTVAFVVLNARTPDGKFDPGVFLILFFPAVGFAAFVGISAIVAEVVMHDFILPHMAIENASFGEAWRIVRQRIRAEKETFATYLIVRVMFPAIVTIALVIIEILPLMLGFWVLSTSAAGFQDMFDDSTTLGAVFGVAFQILFVLLGLAFGLFVAFSLGGPLATWVRNYALVFYGSRYAPLGEVLCSTAQQQPPLVQ
jgi:hypothetical protein